MVVVEVVVEVVVVVVGEAVVKEEEEEEECLIIQRAVVRPRSVQARRSRSDLAEPFLATKITRQPRKIV